MLHEHYREREKAHLFPQYYKMDEVTDSSGGDKENMPSGTTEQAHVQVS